MSDRQTPDDAPRGIQGGSENEEPFRSSGSGASFDAAGNWGTQRRRDQPTGDGSHGMEGAPSGAGYGGFGPEGNYADDAGRQNADVLGQVDGDRDRLAREAQSLGTPRPDRAFTGSNLSAADREAEVRVDEDGSQHGPGRRDAGMGDPGRESR